MSEDYKNSLPYSFMRIWIKKVVIIFLWIIIFCVWVFDIQNYEA